MPQNGSLRSVANQTNSAVDLVTAEIRRAVLNGTLAPGQQFSIRGLAEQLGVSHIPIREALRRLETQGLIVLRQARSATVAPLSSDDLRNIYRLRHLIEPPLAAASVGKFSPGQADRLRALLEESRATNPDTAWQAHAEFHAALVEPAANEWDHRLLTTLWTASERYTHLVFDPTNISDVEREERYQLHRVLLEAALGDDAERMRNELADHFGYSTKRALASLEALQSPAS
ncbi:GntR family transcriptional regulator [Epidermidibacterium keratini]|uniref:GntR family transcriptional regulator n=1 Tax=Epidermidibacterium keratini TaxID=1891644 RepID=A0A7L4YKD7_9ACTN|nr:GntR family transcriptional regulator [Epidermidibacterium keratini]QHB99303.1 GntR family transcriptional regulator [Epidermidibacterium keratini]